MWWKVISDFLVSLEMLQQTKVAWLGFLHSQDMKKRLVKIEFPTKMSRCNITITYVVA